MGSLTSSTFYEYSDLSHPTFDQPFADCSKVNWDRDAYGGL